jgi:hypothetical protein
MVEMRCRHCHAVHAGDVIHRAFDVVLTDRGRKYLANWRRAYGSAGVT